MEISYQPVCCFIFILLVVCIHSCCDGVVEAAEAASTSDQRRTYIVHVHSNSVMSHRQWHQSFLPVNSSQGLLFSYKHAMSGFAAMLTEEEVEALSKKDGFLHAHPSKDYKLHTTHSPNFLGLKRPPIEGSNNNIWRDTFSYGNGVIIGILDTGISSTHPSFDDSGMSPPPEKWKGSCEPPIICNNKIIGARSFIFNSSISSNASEISMDENGHGTHTAGTAAGRFVDDASVLGSAKGTASGIAPNAHLAIYKVCEKSSCPTASILAGMDKAMEDGVDVISLSLGSLEESLYNDPVSIASFKAVTKGIFVSASAGNRGPRLSTLGNASPWIFTVGASTIDRKILAVVKLSNGNTFQGESAYQPTDFNSKSFFPLVYPESNTDIYSPYCENVTTLKTVGVERKIVLCNAGIVSREEAGSNVQKAGGVAMIWLPPSRYGFRTSANADVFPTSGVNYEDGYKILNQYYNNPNLTATIEFSGTQIGRDYPAPTVASFSSRGPSKVTPGFVKPDIIGPGVNILAAWPYPVGAFNVSPAFNIISGTSMSCPHLSGVAALLKSAHPEWSPASIKSAIITTSYWNNNDLNNIVDQFDRRPASFNVMGSGHVNPIKANNPGLVYDITEPNEKYYLPYLCGLGYSDMNVSIFTGKKSMCSDVKTTIDGVDLNYPSVVVALGKFNNYSRSFSRVVTNVAGLTNYYYYNLTVSPPHGVIVNIEPTSLEFTSNTGRQLRFTVSVSFDAKSRGYASPLEEYGYFAWISMDKQIIVTSPIIVTKEGNFYIG